jgi:hypothetical protein
VPEVSEGNFNDVGTQAVRLELPFVDIFASGFVAKGMEARPPTVTRATSSWLSYQFEDFL